MKHLRIPPLMATAAVALSLVLGGCGSSNTMEEPDPPPPPPEPMPMAASGEVMLTTQQQKALDGALGSRESQTVHVAAGETAKRAGVTFTCNSAYPCMITVEDNLGTIVAMWESETLGEGTASVMASGLEPPPETFAQLNEGSAASIGAITRRAINADPVAADPDATPPTAAMPRGAYGRDADGTMDENVIGGLGLRDSGAADNSMVTLLSGLDPNGTGFMPATTTPAAPAKGTMLTAGMDNDEIPVGEAAISGWDSQALFRDWGDTADGGDGGFETGALIFSNIEAPVAHPFDADLADMFVNANAKSSYAFSVRFATGVGTTDVNTFANDAVSISVSAGQMASEQTDSMMLDVGGAQLETLATTVPNASEHKGTYFGAAGTYKCVTTGGGTCRIKRDMGGATPFEVDLAMAATWVFMPDDGEMIMVPDQDWMVFGAWLTTPDNPNGSHRVGAFYDGMQNYGAASSNVFTISDAAGLHGSATYTGGAAGVYSHRGAAGLFTADAELTANFDKDGDATSDSGDYSISGRIDNFRGTDGLFLGADTRATPNDPDDGGENDWVVMLGMDELDATVAGNGYVTGNTTGSADGVTWTGTWTGQLYGPTMADMDSVAPSGVGGQFQSGNAHTSVVGAFGAEMMSDDN